MRPAVVRTPMLRKTAAAKLPGSVKHLPLESKIIRVRKRAPATGLTDRDGYTAVVAEDVDDLSLLPRRFDHFAAEVRQSFEILANQILPKLDSIAAKQVEQGEDIHALKRDVTELRRDNVELKRDRAEVAQRLAAVEKHLFKRPARRRKK